MNGLQNWAVVWTDVHYGQEFESDESSQEAALAEAYDLLRVGHTVKSIVGPDGVTIGQEVIGRYYHARPPP